MGRFDGRVAVVTGAARGIGFGTAKRFAEEGAAVAILDLDEGAASEAAAKLGAEKSVGIGCDVSDAASAEAAVERVVEELGGIHILVNNAGITRDNLLFKLTEEDWDLVMGVHLKGAFLMTKAAQRLASAVVEALGDQGSFVAGNYTVCQSVPHLHQHVVPRTKGDGLRGFFWPRTKYAGPEERAEYAARLRSALG